MKYKNSLVFLLGVFFISSCANIEVPESFTYKEIPTSAFTLASWQKLSPSAPASEMFKIYIEGDGSAFDKYGYPTSDPTPKGKMIRELAFGDTYSPNVIYLARPCQFVKDRRCSQTDWTGGRFSRAAVAATCSAIQQTAGNNPVILIGYSGGAMIAGLSAVLCPSLNVKKVITISGNLNHRLWTEEGGLTPLTESLNLFDYKERFADIPQLHYMGEDDDVVPNFVSATAIKDKSNIIIIKDADHATGFKEIYPKIWNEH